MGFILFLVLAACVPQKQMLVLAEAPLVTSDLIYYGRNSLSVLEQKAYDVLLEAWQKEKKQVTFHVSLQEKEFATIMEALRRDRPMLDAVSILPSGLPVRSCELRIKPEWTRKMEEIEESAAPMLEGLSKDDVVRAMELHDRLLAQVSYRKGPAQAEDSTVYGALVNGIAICDGYTKSYQYLCQQAGLSCYAITGRSTRGIPHAWNMVNFPQGWRYVDTTWDESSYLRSYHDYFMISRQELLLEHIPADDTPVLPSGEGPGYYAVCGYSADSDSLQFMEEVALAFARQLRDYPPPPGEKALFLEIKITGGQYVKGRDRFQKSLFPLLVEINAEARKLGAPYLLETEGPVEYNFNDTTHVLTIFPVTKQNK